MLVLFTDLDGTLLDHFNYSWSAALPALRKAQRMGVPVIMASSKTCSEMQYYHSQLNFKNEPFITENGSALYYQPGYFHTLSEDATVSDLHVEMYGVPVKQIVHFLEKLETKHRTHFRGFHNASLEEIREETGLEEKAILRSRKREFSVPLFYSESTKHILQTEIEKSPFRLIFGGRFIHVLGQVDKGQALRNVMKKMRAKFADRKLYAMAIGDSLNDFPMLLAADVPVLVRKHDGRFETRSQIPNAHFTKGIGPIGWNEAVIQVLESGEYNE